MIATRIDNGGKLNVALNQEEKQQFIPEVLSPGNKSNYELNLKMDTQGKFYIHSKINIENISEDDWGELVFYFIPNMFTQENSPSIKDPAIVEIESVKVNGTKASFNMKKDTFTVLLVSVLPPGNEATIDIQYSFKLPKYGIRFTKKNNNYYLAQWYPMLATYRDGAWNKEDYQLFGDPYHTSFSNFTVDYEIPKEYTIVTTSSDDIHPNKNSGYLKSDNVKEFFIAFLKTPSITQKEIDGINIRVFGVGNYEEYNEEILQIACEAVQYFQQTIGEYPYKQLDIILDGKGMEYPGVVTAGTIGNDTIGSNELMLDPLKKLVVHEIAHQWFYSVISNDPFYDGWLDESFAVLTTELFFSDLYNYEFSPKSNFLDEYTLPVNLPLNSYSSGNVGTYNYTKPMINLWNIFKETGGKSKLEEFLKSYYDTYQYKELNTQEFIRFMSYFLDLENDNYFEDWIVLE